MDLADYTPRDGESQRFEDENDVSLLAEAVINEKAGPELLQFDAELLARLEASLEAQEATVEQLEQGQGGEAAKLTRVILMHEMQRVRYLIQSYYRARLLKVEEYCMILQEDPELQDRLSPRELQYAQEYFFLVGKHLKENVLKGLPRAFDSLLKQSNASEGQDMVPVPELEKHVFVHVLQDRGTVDLDENGDDSVDFNKGDVYMVPYKPIRNLLQDRWVRLI